ncbi:hypothetical protein DH2020_010628 [Rehmannia glutinosa]|uniref:Endonuclease/exonuclease/phosphatase domain-containing protein n=1 Tax=Rehmannia glutinosa TaxID=99300 RepID=A0ABR0XB69_REHGL
MDQFRQVLADTGLHDLGYTGNPFTWSNGQGGESNIVERLDRALATETWQNIYPEYKVHHLPRLQSDHAPISISVTLNGRQNSQSRARRKKIFRFEKIWLEHEKCEEIITQAWQHADGGSWSDKLLNCSQALSAWDKNEFGNVREKIVKLEKKIVKLQACPQTETVIEECEQNFKYAIKSATTARQKDLEIHKIGKVHHPFGIPQHCFSSLKYLRKCNHAPAKKIEHGKPCGNSESLLESNIFFGEHAPLTTHKSSDGSTSLPIDPLCQICGED